MLADGTKMKTSMLQSADSCPFCGCAQMVFGVAISELVTPQEPREIKKAEVCASRGTVESA
jgi:hypothetical protein